VLISHTARGRKERALHLPLQDCWMPPSTCGWIIDEGGSTLSTTEPQSARINSRPR
jgi:hypothetical protein